MIIAGYIRPERDFSSIGNIHYHNNVCVHKICINKILSKLNCLLYDFVLFIFTEELIKEIKNDIAITEQQLEEPVANRLKNDDFLIMTKTNNKVNQ